MSDDMAVHRRVFDRQTKPSGPHGWIQWKGTQVCMDVFCKCGFHGHIDAEFSYAVRCMKCGTTYAVNGHVELVELTSDDEREHFQSTTVDVEVDS